MKLHDNIKELLENRREKLKENLVIYEARMFTILEIAERVRGEINQLSKILGEKTYRESCVSRGEPFSNAMNEIWKDEAKKKEEFLKSVLIIVASGSLITPPKEK